ncbi:S23 ribosomal protein [Leptolyngbya sp. PCC 7375]|nr:S23 ribosomal protein [Leptolyngbya sp. PCC 7375]
MSNSLITSHRELKLYEISFDSAMQTFNLVQDFPPEERALLTDQILKSSRSVCANLVERLRRQKQAARTAAKRQRHLERSHNRISLRGLPKAIAAKIREVMTAIDQGAQYWQLAGKQLTHWRQMIRIPVTRRYRLLCQADGDGVKLLTHEDYNKLVSNPRRMK